MKKTAVFALCLFFLFSVQMLAAADWTLDFCASISCYETLSPYDIREDGSYCVCTIYEGLYGDEWIPPEELSAEAFAEQEGISFTYASEYGQLFVYAHGLKISDTLRYTVRVKNDARNISYESQQYSCLMLPMPEDIYPIAPSEPLADIGTGEGLDIPELMNTPDIEQKISPFDSFTLSLPYIYTQDDNWRLTYAVSADTLEVQAGEPFTEQWGNGLYNLPLSGFTGEGTVVVDYYLQYTDGNETVFSRKVGSTEIPIEYRPFEVVWNFRNNEVVCGSDDTIVGEIGGIYKKGVLLSPDEYTLSVITDHANAVFTFVPNENGTTLLTLSGIDQPDWISLKVCFQEKSTGQTGMHFINITCVDAHSVDYSAFSSIHTYDPSAARIIGIYDHGAELPLSDFEVEITSTVPGISYTLMDDGWILANTISLERDCDLDIRTRITHKETGEIWLDRTDTFKYKYIPVPELTCFTEPDPNGYQICENDSVSFSLPRFVDPEAESSGWYIDVRSPVSGIFFSLSKEDNNACVTGIAPGRGTLFIDLVNDQYASSSTIAEYYIDVMLVPPTVSDFPCDHNCSAHSPSYPAALKKGETYALKKPMIGRDGSPADGWYFVLDGFCYGSDNEEIFSMHEDEEYFYITGKCTNGSYLDMNLQLHYGDMECIIPLHSYSFETVSDELEFDVDLREYIHSSTCPSEFKQLGSVKNIRLNGEPLSPEDVEVHVRTVEGELDIVLNDNPETAAGEIPLQYNTAADGEATIIVSCKTKDGKHYLSKIFTIEIV